MVTVFILTAQLANGFTMMPMVDETACNDALAALPPAIIESAECYPIEMIVRGSRYAPEMSPLPAPKPGRRV